MAVDTVGNQNTTVSEAYSVQATDITVTVGTDKNRILSGVRIYAFTATSSYLGLFADTDGDGQVSLQLPGGEYLFRADYQDKQFWSDITVNLSFNAPHSPSGSNARYEGDDIHHAGVGSASVGRAGV